MPREHHCALQCVLTSHSVLPARQFHTNCLRQVPGIQWAQAEKGTLHCQVGSPLPAPVPTAAPAPHGREVVAHVSNKSLAPAHAPGALPSPRTVEASPYKPKGTAAQSAQFAQEPAAAAQLPAPASGPVLSSPSPTQGPAQPPSPAMTVASYSTRDALSYITGRR